MRKLSNKCSPNEKLRKSLLETVRAEPVEACSSKLRDAKRHLLRQDACSSALRQAQGERFFN